MSKFLSNLLAKGVLTVDGLVTAKSGISVINPSYNGTFTFAQAGNYYSVITGAYGEQIVFGEYGNTISLKANVIYLTGAQVAIGGNIYWTSGASFTQSYFLPAGGSRGVVFSSNYTNSGAGGVWEGSHIVSEANVNTAISVTGVTINQFVSSPTVNVTDGTTVLRGFYHNPTLTSTVGLTNYAFESTSGKVKISDLAGAGTRMVTTSPTGILGTTALPESLVINNNNEYRIITGSATANTLNASSKLAWYNDLGILYLEATASWGYGAEIDFDNRPINGTQWGIYGGDPGHPGMVMYRYLPSGKDVSYWDIDRFAVASDVKLGFSSTGSAIGSLDVAIAREAAGIVQINNGTTNNYASLKALNLTATGELVVNSRFTVGSYDSGSGGTNINTYLELKNFNNDAYGEGLVLAYSRGTMAAPQNVQTGDVIGGLYYRAHSGGAPRNAAYIESVVTGVGTYAKTKLHFATSADDSYAYVGMILNEDAKLFVGYNLVDQGAYRLQVGGAIYASGALLTSLAGTGSRMVVADTTGTLSTTAIPGETDTLYSVTQRGNTTFGDIVVNGKGSFTDHVTINTDPALFAGSAYNGYKVLGVGSTTGGGLSFVSSNGIAAEVFGDNGPTGLYLASYGAVPVITFYLNTTEVAKYKTNGDLLIANLAGTGTRMVVADATGTLSTQALPTPITNYVTTDTTQTISGQKTFSALTTIFDSTQTATFIEGKASGVLYGGISFSLFFQFNAYPAATQGFLWKNGLGSNVMALTQAGVLNLATLAGTGTRMVVADTNGNLGSQAIPTGSLQGAVDADKNTSGSLAVGTTTVKSVSATTYSGVFFDYVVKNGTNVRVGSVVAITNGTNVEFYETLSNDIGSTTGLTFTVTLGSGNMNLNAVAASTGFTVIVSTRAI